MQLRLEQADRSRKDFIANASHELRTPLFTLGGFLELLDDEDLDTGTAARVPARDARAGDAGWASWRPTCSTCPGWTPARSTSPASRSTWSATAARPGARVPGPGRGPRQPGGAGARRPATLPHAIADEQRVQQIGRALVDNAIRHTPRGTEVRVAVDAAGRRRPAGRGRRRPGDRRATRRRTCSSGSTAARRRSAAGSGLGLAIARELAERMGGSLELRLARTARRPSRSACRPSPAAAEPDARLSRLGCYRHARQCSASTSVTSRLPTTRRSSAGLSPRRSARSPSRCKGRRMLHLSATAFGGGVAEIQYTLIPLLNDAGIETEWRVIHGRDEFFDVTKTIHNALQGDPRGADRRAASEIFTRYNQLNADALDGRRRVGHDRRPRPAAGRHPRSCSRPRGRSGCGAATSTCPAPNPRRARLPAAVARPATTPPSSTCTSTCRRPTALREADHLAAGDRSAGAQEHGARARRTPPTSSISSASTWSGRCCCRCRGSTPGRTRSGVIDAYRIGQGAASRRAARRWSARWPTTTPRAGSSTTRPSSTRGDDPDIYILSNLNNVGAVEVNAFQVHAAVCMQKSIKEGFGLTVSEALWKARPMIGGRVGGIVRQIEDGVTGYTGVSAPRSAPRGCWTCWPIPAAARAMARRGKEHVRTQVPDAAPGARLAGADAPAGRRGRRARRPRRVLTALRPRSLPDPPPGGTVVACCDGCS